MEELNGKSKDEFSPIEIARNRLAKLVFALCATLAILVFTANDSAVEFGLKEKELLRRVHLLHEIQNRLARFLGRDESYLADRLVSAFEWMCLSSPEAGAVNIPPGSTLTLGLANPANSPVTSSPRRCKPEYLQVKVHSKDAFEKISAQLKYALSAEDRPSIAIIRVVREGLSAQDKVRWDILIRYWGESGLLELIVGRWLNWSSMKQWMIKEENPVWLHSSKKSRLLDDYGSGYVNIGTSWNTAYSGLGSLSDRFKKRDSSNQDFLDDHVTIGMAKDEREAWVTLQSRIKDAKDAHKAHSPDVKWSSAAIGGLSVPLLQWLEWLSVVIVVFLALFIVFDIRSDAERGASSRCFWFPRLGRPKDPFGTKVSDFGEFVAAGFWIAFWVLPVVLCYWAAVLRFNAIGDSIFGRFMWRGLSEHPADLANALALLMCVVLTVQGTKPIATWEQLKNLRTMQILGVCIVSAFCATLVIAIDQIPTSLDLRKGVALQIVDGQVYLLTLSWVFAIAAIANSKVLSRFSAVVLCTLSISNYALVICTVMDLGVFGVGSYPNFEDGYGR